MDSDLISLGFASQTFQQSPALLEIGLRAVGAKVQLTLNAVCYYSFADVVKARKFLDECDGGRGQSDA